MRCNDLLLCPRVLRNPLAPSQPFREPWNHGTPQKTRKLWTLRGPQSAGGKLWGNLNPFAAWNLPMETPARHVLPPNGILIMLMSPGPSSTNKLTVWACLQKHGGLHPIPKTKKYTVSKKIEMSSSFKHLLANVTEILWNWMITSLLGGLKTILNLYCSNKIWCLMQVGLQLGSRKLCMEMDWYEKILQRLISAYE